MSEDELLVQLVKIIIMISTASYFIWWSLEVLSKL